MSAPPRLPLHLGDYLKDTPPVSRANWEHHGIYLLALMITWNTAKCQLPNDEKWLSLRFGCSIKEYHENIKPVLEMYYQTDGNFWTQKRLEKEWKYVLKFSKLQSARVKSRWDKDKDPYRNGDPVIPESPSGNTPIQVSKKERKKESRTGIYQDLTDDEKAKFAAEFGHRCLAVLGWNDLPVPPAWGMVHQWLADGLEPDRIVSTLEGAKADGRMPRTPTLKYFDRMVHDAADPRLDIPADMRRAGGNGYKHRTPEDRHRAHVEFVLHHAGQWEAQWGEPPAEVVAELERRAEDGLQMGTNGESG